MALILTVKFTSHHCELPTWPQWCLKPYLMWSNAVCLILSGTRNIVSE
jgi:hypothetical protein